MWRKVKSFGLVAALLTGFCVVLAEPAGAAAGLAGVRDAVGLLMDNQLRAKELLDHHQTAVRKGQVAAFRTEQEDMILQGNAQPIVAIRLLNTKPQTAPVPDQLKGEEIARRMYDLNRKAIFLALAPLDEAGIDQRRKELRELDREFEAEVRKLPDLVSDYARSYDRKDAVLKHHKEEILAEMMAAYTGRGGSGGPTVMDPEEYKRKLKAIEDKKAADARYRELRMKEIEEHNQRQEAERKKAEATRAAVPPPPPAPPRDLAMIQAWHKAYSLKIQPFKRALGKVLSLDRSRQSKDLALACGELGSVAQQLMVDRALVSRSLALNSIIDTMLREYKTASADCSAGELVKFEADLKRGEASLGQMAAWLQPYSLSL